MHPKRPLCAALVLALVLTGCGTVSSLDRPDGYVYSGVRFDLDQRDWAEVIAWFDLPFSFVLDTLLLPFTVTIDLLQLATR